MGTTYAESLDTYLHDCGYDLDDDQAACKRFIRACRQLLQHQPKRAGVGGQGGHETERDPAVLQSQLKKAERWLRAKQMAAAGGGLRFGSAGLEEFRR
jgi:hypothetical protein